MHLAHLVAPVILPGVAEIGLAPVDQAGRCLPSVARRTCPPRRAGRCCFRRHRRGLASPLVRWTKPSRTTKLEINRAIHFVSLASEASGALDQGAHGEWRREKGEGRREREMGLGGEEKRREVGLSSPHPAPIVSSSPTTALVATTRCCPSLAVASSPAAAVAAPICRRLPHTIALPLLPSLLLLCFPPHQPLAAHAIVILPCCQHTHCSSPSPPTAHIVTVVDAIAFFSTHTSNVAAPLPLAATTRFLPCILLCFLPPSSASSPNPLLQPSLLLLLPSSFPLLGNFPATISNSHCPPSPLYYSPPPPLLPNRVATSSIVATALIPPLVASSSTAAPPLLPLLLLVGDTAATLLSYHYH
ncbi:hypothetical protein BHE74_00043329 [Ensete ventricosum]|nr:hypothetical protein BHE74_00043329 [Ensete ventricosum]